MTVPGAQSKTYTRSLSRKFILRLLLILLMGQCVTLAWSLYTNKQIQTDGIRQKLTLSGTQLAALAIVSRASFDFTYLGQLVDELIKDADILRITYVDNGMTIVDRKEAKSPGTVMQLEMPVIDAGQPVGKLLFEYTDNRVVQNVIKQAAFSVALMTVLYGALAFFVYYFFKRDIGSKVSNIKRTLDRLTKGDLTCIHEDSADDEFGSISEGLEFLIRWLATTVEKYKSISESVADATDLLNKTFKNLINGVNSQHVSTENAMRSLQGAINSLEQIIESSENLLKLSDASSSALNGILATAEKIVGKMDRLSGNVNSSYESVAAITRSSREVAASAERANSSMEFADFAISNISQSVIKINGFVAETTGLVQKADTIIAERGIKSVQDAIESMHGIEETVVSLAKTIANLGSRSKDIAKVLDVIKEVTEQTKLLALNAQILSGQAGEHGKPFAVVASEMKSLSDKTAYSTKEIESIVSAIQGEIHAAVKSTDYTSSIVMEGKAVASRAGEALHSIQESSGRSLEMVRSIEEVAVEQNHSLAQIIDAFAELRKLIDEVTRATSEEEQGMTSLLEGVGAIRNAVDLTRKASEEQARSIQQVSKNISSATDRTRSISGAGKDHRDASLDVLRVMESIIETGAETVKDVRDVSSRISAMNSEVESLKREIKAFKTNSST